MSAAPDLATASACSRADMLRGRLMQASLKVLLDRVRGAREVLPHLAALEAALGRRGPAAIDAIAPRSLAKICSQLSSLPLPAKDPPLHDLLARLLDALDAPQRALGGQPHQRSTFDTESKLMVGDASHSEFEAAGQEQACAQRSAP